MGPQPFGRVGREPRARRALPVLVAPVYLGLRGEAPSLAAIGIEAHARAPHPSKSLFPQALRFALSFPCPPGARLFP